MSASHRFGPFFLDARIAVGGTAEVYLARPAAPDSGLPPKLVVKRLLPHFVTDAQGRTMFEREARLHAAVNHPNVVSVFHAGTEEKGEPYLAMEYVDGVDGYRLLRRLRQEDELLPTGVAVHVARQVLLALESVHAARDPSSGGSLGIVHRDVTPSNIYLSREGAVKLGDFGIARSTTRATLRSEAGNVLKGKFAYLSPEQVAGESSDHRADLFSLASVLAETLLNRPLFPGGGQLAILLAIRDCKIDALAEIAPRLPPGLFAVMQRALARDPADRYASAAEFSAALAPFEVGERLAVHEIAARVRWVQQAPSSDHIKAIRESASMRRAARAEPPSEAPPSTQSEPAPEPMPASEPLPVAPTLASMTAVSAPGRPAPPRPRPRGEMPAVNVTRRAPDEGRMDGRKTEEYEFAHSWVVRESGEQLGPWSFARLMEALATGQVEPSDRIDFLGRGLKLASQIDELARFFPSTTATTNQLAGPGAPDFREVLDDSSMLTSLMTILLNRETGVLFVTAAGNGNSGRKELYFLNGKLHHVVSSNASELLGEYLVRRGKLQREELDLALAVLPRYGGRMGDTLIALGLVGPVDIFRAIREQGRDRVADLFSWKNGNATFYRGEAPPHVEFPLDLDLAPLMLAGLSARWPGDALLDHLRPRLDRAIGLVTRPVNESARTMVWPEMVQRVRSWVGTSKSLRALVNQGTSSGVLSAGDILRAFELLRVAGLVQYA